MNNITTNIWNELLDNLKASLSKHAFQTYFSGIKLGNIDDKLLEIKVDNNFLKDWLEEHYSNHIIDILLKITNKRYIVRFISAKENSISRNNIPIKNNISTKQKKYFLLPEYTFDNFIVGESNRFAYAAAKAVSESPGTNYNPLLIYSNSGLGKTHLLQAIGNHVLNISPDKKLIYLTSEQFTNEYIHSLTSKKIKSFQNKFRNADILLIDDIHFLAGKARSCEEFFHTFNTLYESKCQVVMTSDKPPKDMQLMENRLKTRLEWGLMADIQLPSYETRIAILRSKIKNKKINIPDDVADYISKNIYSNIRELEGALLKIIAAFSLTNQPITLENTKEILKDFLKITDNNKSITVDNIKKTVAKYFNISTGELSGKRRSKNLVLPRHIAMYLSRKLTSYSLPEIGNYFGGKDHVTIIHANKKISKLVEKNPNLKNDIDNIVHELKV